jgi:hypothetical protein
MKATNCCNSNTDTADNDNNNTSLPRLPVSRLVGHDGPVQAVTFTGMETMFCTILGFSLLNDKTATTRNERKIHYDTPFKLRLPQLMKRYYSRLNRWHFILYKVLSHDEQCIYQYNSFTLN